MYEKVWSNEENHDMKIRRKKLNILFITSNTNRFKQECHQLTLMVKLIKDKVVITWWSVSHFWRKHDLLNYPMTFLFKPVVMDSYIEAMVKSLFSLTQLFNFLHPGILALGKSCQKVPENQLHNYVQKKKKISLLKLSEKVDLWLCCHCSVVCGGVSDSTECCITHQNNTIFNFKFTTPFYFLQKKMYRPPKDTTRSPVISTTKRDW